MKALSLPKKKNTNDIALNGGSLKYYAYIIYIYILSEVANGQIESLKALVKVKTKQPCLFLKYRKLIHWNV